MIRTVKNAAKRLCFLAGLDVKRVNPAEHNYEWLRRHDIQTILDIGANVGQFAAMIHPILPGAAIYAFEPLKDCYEQLLANMQGIAGFHAFNWALGDHETSAAMCRSEHSPSSSLLEMADLHKEAFPSSRTTAREVVAVRCLDDVARELNVAGGLLVKIDVQGYEDRVIRGGRETLSRASVLIVETSFRELYRGQALFGVIHDMLARLGFFYAGALGQWRNRLDGSVLQADSIFVRPSA